MRPPRTVSSNVTSALGARTKVADRGTRPDFRCWGRAGNRSSHATYPASTRISAASSHQRPAFLSSSEHSIQARFRSFPPCRYLAIAVMLK